MRMPAPLGSVTLSVFAPERRPLTTPNSLRLPLRTSERRTLRLPTVTFARRTSAAREKSMRTSAEWPLTRSARLDSTPIETFERAAASAGTADTHRAASAATNMIKRHFTGVTLASGRAAARLAKAFGADRRAHGPNHDLRPA